MSNDKKLNYARDDVFIISVNNSSDKIEKIEASIYLEPMNIYPYFATISALYSKTHTYIKESRKLDKKLEKLREALYNEKFIKDLKENYDKEKTKKQFIKLLDGLISVYRNMTEDYTMGIFPKVEIIDTKPGVTKRKG